MTDQIINKVAKSGLITLDLTDYAPKSEILEFDVINFLFEKNVLIEKEFRKQLKKERFEFVVSPIDFINKQHWGFLRWI